MISNTAVWLCLIAHAVYGITVVTINNDGANNCNCCKECSCSCSSLLSALQYIHNNNTVINVTSKVVALDSVMAMGLGNLDNITITGNDAIVMCNNTGGVRCESCSNVIIRGITWHQCGRSDPIPSTKTPALNFTTVANVTIYNCIFQGSSGCPVYINNAQENVVIVHSNFLNNNFEISQHALNCAGFYVDSARNIVNISILSSKFHRNGCAFLGTSDLCHYYGVIITIGHSCELVKIVFESTEFCNNSRGLFFNSGYTKTASIQLSNVNVYNNYANGIILSTSPLTNSTINIEMSFINLINNVNPLCIIVPSNGERVLEATISISMNDSVINSNIANDTTDPYYQGTASLGVLGISLTSTATVVAIVIRNSLFHSNINGAVGMRLALHTSCELTYALIAFSNVTINNTTTTNDDYIMYTGIASVYVAISNVFDITINFTDVGFTLNDYSLTNGEVLHIENNQDCDNYILESKSFIYFENANFYSNTAFDYVVFLSIQINSNNQYSSGYSIDAELSKCYIESNFGGEGIFYMHVPSPNVATVASVMKLGNSKFTHNKGPVFYMFSIVTTLMFAQTILFESNTADSGAAIYFQEINNILSDNADLHCINNSATQKGGAFYFNILTDKYNVFSNPFCASFINNLAKIAGNSIYFSIPYGCQINRNISDKSSLMYVPSKFNYSQPIRSKYSPVVTSPYNIKLYPPAFATNHSSNDYVIQESKMLGESIQYNTSVLDYFNNITEPVLFILSCITCGDEFVLSTYQVTVHDRSLNELKVFPTVPRDVVNNTNILITMLSVLSPIYKNISVSLSIELSHCHVGYIFDELQGQCVCYPYSDIVHCNEKYSEIKIGYWIGFLKKQHYTLSSICPKNYCNFAKRTETSPGYCYLPRIPDDQCNLYRTGVACGECKPGYTLAYDSPECINTDKCSAGMICLVIVLTILYWIAIVAVVFILMYFSFKVPLGYFYALIYYYSIVDILLVNGLPDAISQLVDSLSSLATLTPPLFGQLCLVEGLSGIDQQFIHYFHALAVSLILLIIVLAARYSGRLSRLISPCIIRVICLLLLLAYTCLHPLHFSY